MERTYITSTAGPQIKAESWAEAERKAQELGVTVVSDVEADLYTAQQTFALAKNVLISAAAKSKQNCLLFFGDENCHGSAMSSNTDLSDPCMLSSIRRLLESLPLEFRKELERSLAQ